MKKFFDLPQKPERPETDLEKKFELRKQYKEQIQTLTETGLIELLPSGKIGFYDINGKDRQIPDYEEFLEYFNEKYNEMPEFYDMKREQGFTDLLAVPFGMSLNEIIDRTKELILKKYQKGLLNSYYKGEKAWRYDLSLELNKETPVFIPSNMSEVNFNEELVYYPKSYYKYNHGGMKKPLILEREAEMSKFIGVHFLLTQDLPKITSAGEGKVINGRKQIEVGYNAGEYLKKIQTETQYQEEIGFTPEDYLIYFIKYLYQENAVIDRVGLRYGIKGHYSYALNSYLYDTDKIPYFGWLESKDHNHLIMYEDKSTEWREKSLIGCRTCIQI